MARGKRGAKPQLSFIFTASGFVLDLPSVEDAEASAKSAAGSRVKSVAPRAKAATASRSAAAGQRADSAARSPAATYAEALAEESRPWLERFSRDRLAALYDLGFAQVQPWFTPSMRFLHRVASEFLRCTLQRPDIELLREQAEPELDETAIASLLLATPFAPGAEHITAEWLQDIFEQLADRFQESLAAWDGTVEQYVAERSQNLRVPGRIFFHLVENRQGAGDGFPFAFVATYAATTQEGAVQHFPLRYALTEYESDQRKLLALLGGLSRAAERSDFLSGLMESGELFHPLRLTANDAYRFLKDVPTFEDAGVLCRVPNWWKRGAARPNVNVKIGESQPAKLGANALVQLSPSFSVDGEPLTREEVEDLLARTEGLALLKGKWVDVDHQRLQAMLDAFERAEDASLSFFEAMRQAAGEPDEDDLVETTRGQWLDRLLQRMREPAQLEGFTVPESIHAQLRPYQQTGFSWLSYLQDLGFGACLADDMGLGKTLQMLAFLEHLRTEAPSEDGHIRALLVVPASLLGNWERELQKFAPDLDYLMLYGKSAKAMNEEWGAVPDSELRAKLPTLCITTYAMALRIELLERVTWDVLVLDEAQAIKNPGVKQTKTLKALPSHMRVALTGTPVENDLSNLWSVFDFLNPGMLGTLKEFKEYVKGMADSPGGYAPLRRMTSPFLLRRLKTDKSIISDLPDKMETNQYVTLTRKQVVLYRQVVSQMERILADEGIPQIKRQGVVLATIMKLKQVCNHPDQYLGQDAFAPNESGKFLMMQELCQTIYDKRERVLVFTQFREMCDPLDHLLRQLFGRPGCVIHGQVPARKRTKLVEQFQGEDYVPYMVLSVKAGGTGLNLTAANNVIHFDRWWNPAVENQATDRAFRIGQTRDVMVHKMVCSNTLEERIDAIISGKSELAAEVVGEGETWLGKLSDQQLMDIMRFGA